MRIVKNTTPYVTADLARVIRRVHSHMKKLEGRPAPNWQGLRVQVQTTRRPDWNGHHSGWAVYGGRNPQAEYDVHLGLPAPGSRQAKDYGERQFAVLVYHELMHTYGYRHDQYNDLPASEAAQLFPHGRALQLKAGTLERIARAAARPQPVLGRFPITIAIGQRAREEFYAAEYGLHEDTLADRTTGEAKPGRTLCEILDDSPKSGIRLRDQAELEHALWSADSGTWSLYCERACHNFMEAARKHLAAITQPQEG